MLTGFQVDALLSETCLQPEELAAAQATVEQLRNVLLRIKPHQVTCELTAAQLPCVA